MPNAKRRYPYNCQGCDAGFRDESKLKQIEDYSARVWAGELVPAGECPKCGAVVHGPILPNTIQIVVEHLRSLGAVVTLPSETVVLESKPYPGAWEQRKGESFEKHTKRTQALFEKIPASEQISFPIADGAAIYVAKLSDGVQPTRLWHVPLGDGYHANEATLRGLTTQDVSAMLEKSRAIAEIFGGRK